MQETTNISRSSRMTARVTQFTPDPSAAMEHGYRAMGAMYRVSPATNDTEIGDNAAEVKKTVMSLIKL